MAWVCTLTRMLCVNVCMHVRTCSVHVVGRCFWTTVRTWIRTWIHKYTYGADHPKSCPILKSRKSLKSRVFRKSRDFCDFLDFQDRTGFLDFRTWGAKPDLCEPDAIPGSEGPDWSARGFRTWHQSGQVLSRPVDLVSGPEKSCQVRKIGPTRVLIDHFQLPPWWKMTGQDGDPFGGRRWHWPSKRSNFEKNLLITETVKIAEKGTFFSFILENRWKLTIFLPPRSEICRHLRRVVPTAYSTIFPIFRGVKISKFSHFFWPSGNRQNSCPDTNFRKSHFSGKVEIFWILAPDKDFGRFRMVAFKVPKIRHFRNFLDFCDFCDFCWFLRFRTISGFLDFSGNCPKSTILDSSKVDFWGPKISRFLTISDMRRGHEIQCQHATCVVSICTYFFVFFGNKKYEKIYHFGLNHLSNCWLVYAVGSLRPDSFHHYVCNMVSFLDDPKNYH